MDFNLKVYKHLKIKYFFKTVNFFFFFHGTSLNNENWIKIEQILVYNELKYFRVFNTLVYNILKNSIFKNVTLLIHGPIILLRSTSTNPLSYKTLENISSLIDLLCLKINNKVYSKKQIQNLKKMSYKENIIIFYTSMNTFLKIPHSKFAKKKV